MGRALVLSIVVVLATCSRHEPAWTVDALAHDPQHLYALRHRCAAERMRAGEAACRLADAAYARRFFLGLGGPGEYQTLTSLPPMPASFEADDDGAQP
ncbi:hypothetical protein ASG87_03680 [Frateuria sp. Soil773]|uniref:hypothetical protein n=1 Tax=Frateuria sp. Soil773 TaxID=1736407 RepID=UPI0006F54866|nr:hypothetical protein [Frateuria sp. Soil773]KRE89704.1 hypothetical protein ASG87_03680 [Frateuria sp. Soil773]